MTFVDFIKKYYPLRKEEELSFLFKDLCIYSDIESSFNEFYRASTSKNKFEIVSQFTLTCRELITIIHNPILESKTSQQKIKTEQTIIELVSYLINDTYMHSGLEQYEYFYLFKQTVCKTYAKYCWDFSHIEKQFIRENFNEFSNYENGINYNKVTFVSKPIKLYWQGKKHLDLFVGDLMDAFLGIKTKKKIYRLFEENNCDFKIEIPSRHLISFLSLFYNLHQSGAIKVIGNRGLFVFLQNHIYAPQNDQFPNREFRKLRYEAENNDKIKKEIFRVIEPLLDKYS